MSEWKEYRLGNNCIKIGSGATPRGGGDTYLDEGDFALVRSQNILDFTFSYNGLAYISEEQASKLNNVTIKERDVLLNITGDSVARVCQIPKELIPARVNQHVAIIRPKPEIINPEYLKYYLLNPTFKDYMLMLSSSGATRNAITKVMIEDFTILAPSVPEQTAIASILSSLDDKIELNNKINKNLEDLAQALFKQWFVDFEFPYDMAQGKPNEKGKPYKSSGGEMVESELGEIPKGWTVDNLSNVLELIIDYRGKTPLKLGFDWSEEGVIALSAKNVKNRSIYNLDNVHIGSEELYNVWMKDKLQYGDVLLTSEAPLGETALLLKRNRYILSQRLFALRPNSKINPFFLFEWISSDVGQGELERRASGSTVVGIKQSELREISLVVPSTSLLASYQSIVKDIYDSLEANRIENEHLVKLRDSLLPKLISGELEVNEALLQTEKTM